MSERLDVFINGGTMRTLVMFHCLLTFRQFLPLVLSVLSIVVIRSKETFAGTASSVVGSSASGRNSGGGGNGVSDSVFSASSLSSGRGAFSAGIVGGGGAGVSSLSSSYGGGGSGASDQYSSYGGSSSYDNNNTEKPPRNPTVFQIGGVLSNNKSIASFNETIQNLNFKLLIIPQGATLVASPILMDPNPIRTAINVCDYLIKKQIYAVIVSHSAQEELSSAAVSYTSGFYHIPVIGISSRDSAFSDKNIHVSFLRTVPPYSHQADVWVEILKHFHYEKVIFLHSSDTDGRSVLGRFQTNAQNLEDDIEIKIELVVELEPGAGVGNYAKKLEELKNAQARVYLLYASTNDAKAIFEAAASHHLTDAGHVWIVTEQLLRSKDIPQGALGIKLLKADDETAHIKDCLRVFAAALRDMSQEETIMEAPNDCNATATTWETGKKLFEYIKRQELVDGETGKVVFDESGDRINAEYHVINIHPRRMEFVVGQYLYSKEKNEMFLNITDTAIVWPGDSKVKPAGFMIPTHLRVLTIEEVPFVFVRRVEDPSECSFDEEPCPHYNTTDSVSPVVMNCCRGYCIDLLRQLKERMNFTASLALSPDGQFGSCITKNGTGKKEWTGLIAELVNEKAEMIVAPLTITPERAQAIEFSKPFKYQGITILVKTERKDPKFGSFLQPFRGSLWILVMVSVHIVALALYLLDRFSPFGRYRLANMDGTEEDALNLSSAIWFAWGVLLNSGIGEGTPRSFAARVLGIVWAGFAMIIVASYTANLAAFLVLDRPKTQFSGIHDNRLRNPATSFNYSTVKGSAVEMYFRRQVELSNMYRVMERMNYDTAQAAIDAVKKQTLGAFIWDSSRLQYEAAQDCDLMTSGELFGRSGYAIGLQKGSPWANEVTLAILEFHESGFMEKLDERWIINPQRDPNQPPKTCKIDQKVPTTLGLENMHDAFYLIAGGIVGGLVLILIEVFYKKHQLKRQRQLEIARHAADKWRHTVQQRKLERSLEAQRRYKENGPPPFWTPGLECRQRSPIAAKSNTIFV